MWVAYLIRILQIVWLDLILSGDNAVVIALAVRDLPDERRFAASSLGAGAAIGLRVLFALALLALLRLPYLHAIGSLLLVWIAVRLAAPGHEEAKAAPRPSLWSAVRTIALADALMSLDNVLAITAAARGDGWLVLFGLLLSLPLVVGGASMFVRLLARAKWTLWASVALIGWAAGQMFADEPAFASFLRDLPAATFVSGAVGAVLVLAIAAPLALLRPRT